MLLTNTYNRETYVMNTSCELGNGPFENKKYSFINSRLRIDFLVEKLWEVEKVNGGLVNG